MPKVTRKLTDEQIIGLYQSGMPYKEIAPLAGIGDRAIRNVLYKHGIEITRQGAPRKYQVNEDFFETWTPEMAWVLGIMITDGHVQGNTIVFSQKDRRILELVAKCMESKHQIFGPTKNKSALSLPISSRKIVNDLLGLGVTERKSLTVKFPEVPEEMMPHFIRGVIDGDGWVQDRGYVMNVTSASLNFAESLKMVFESWDLRTEISHETSVTGKTFYRVWVKGKLDLVILSNILYNDCGDYCVYNKRDRMSQRA